MYKMKEKLIRSGYNEKATENIIQSGLRGYYQMVENQIRGVRNVNRPQHEDREEREMNKIIAKSTWHLKKKDLNTPSTSGVGAKSNNNRTRAPGQKVGNRDPNNNDTPDYTKVIEAVIFVPFTPGSRLQKKLQENEDTYSKLQNSPRWKFVEM